MPLTVSLRCDGCPRCMEPIAVYPKRLEKAIRELKDEAEALRWKYHGDGAWHCPDCVRIRSRAALVADAPG